MSDNDDLTPEQRAQMQEGLAKARAALDKLSAGGLLGLATRRAARSALPHRHRRRRRVMPLLIGLLIVFLSMTTCSAGVNLDAMTAEYGPPVSASTTGARQFVERFAATMRNAGTARRIRIDVTESEATSVLSLGLMAPELMRAAQEFPPQVWQETDDIDRIRELLRQRRRIDSDTLTFPQRMARWVDPQLHTGDVQVQFTETGEVVVAGYVQAWRWRQSGLVVLAPRAGAGRLELDFVRLRLGRLPIPTVVFDVASRLVTSLILRGRDIAEISDLTVTGSRLTLEARLHR